MFSRPGDDREPSIVLPNHEGLSAMESAEKINIFFSAISQEYKHLDVADLPDRVKTKLSTHICEHPVLHDFEIYNDLKHAKKTASTPLDVPIDILNEFLPELITPIAAIFREAIASHEWPMCYKQEWHLPIKKKQLPKSEDDLRTLGLTPFFSKRLEAILIKWIWPYIHPHLSPDQMGGVPGSSVVHYLTRMIYWILDKLDDNNKPTAVLAALIDFSKGFNRMSPVILITLLSDLNIPTCALRLIISYLSNRSMVTTFNGAVSSKQLLCGGGPQGSLLIVLLFCIQINHAGDPCPRVEVNSCALEGAFGPLPKPVYSNEMKLCHVADNTTKKIYIDDLSILESLNLKKCLVTANPNFIGPMNFHERNRKILPAHESILQHKLEDLQNFTKENLMLINKQKTVIIPFNFSKSYDFVPTLSFPGEEYPLSVVYETKLLGVTIRSDLSFSTHVNNIVKAASSCMWLLLRFRDMGANRDQLLNLWFQKGRSILEFASPVFFSRLTEEDKKKIEGCQRKAFAIILQKEFKSYANALVVLGQNTLEDRRIQAAIKFGQKCLTNPKHMDMFPRNVSIHNEGRRSRKPYKEYFCRTNRFYRSSIPTITRLLNEKYLMEQQDC